MFHQEAAKDQIRIDLRVSFMELHLKIILVNLKILFFNMFFHYSKMTCLCAHEGVCMCDSISFFVPHCEEIALQMKLIHFLQLEMARKVKDG